MTNDDKLEAAFRRAFILAEHRDVRSLQYNDDLGRGRQWDSLAHMVLCTQIEDAFDVMIEIEMISQIRSYASAQEALRQLGVEL